MGHRQLRARRNFSLQPAIQSRGARMTARVGFAQKLPSSIYVSILVILLLGSSVSCSRQASPKPVTLTYLDVEWEAPDELSGIWRDLQDFTRQTGIHVKRLPAPDGSLNQLALWKELLRKGSTTPDVCNAGAAESPGVPTMSSLETTPLFPGAFRTLQLGRPLHHGAARTCFWLCIRRNRTQFQQL